MSRQCLFRDSVEAEPRREHQPFLRPPDGDVDLPGIVAVIDRGEGRDRVDHEQRRVMHPVDRLADLGDPAGDPGRGLVVDHAHRLDRVRLVGGELLLDQRRIDPVPPIARHKLDIEPEPRRHLMPQSGEMAGFEHQHPLVGRQRVAKRGLPRPGAGRRIDDDGVFGLEDPLHPGDDLLPEEREFRPAMVDRRHRDRLQYPVRNIRRAGDLQEMAAAMVRGDVPHRQRRLSHTRP